MNFHKLYAKAVHNVLGKIWIPPSNMNLARRNMPQITAKNLTNYMEWLQEGGVKVDLTTVNGAELTPTQLDINENKIRSLIVNNPPKLDKPIIVSSDNFVIDGHHRWIAKINMSHDKNTVPVNAYRVDLPVKQLLKKSMLYPRVFYTDVEGNSYTAPERGTWI